MRVHNPNDRYCLARAVVIGLTKIRLVDQGDANNGSAHFRTFCQQQEQHVIFVNYLMNISGLPNGLQVLFDYIFSDLFFIEIFA